MFEGIDLFMIILWTAALYGGYSFYNNLLRSLSHKTSSTKLPIIDIVFIVKNQEQTIEHVVQRATNMINTKNDRAKEINLLVIDNNSTDQTLDILNILSEKYRFLKVRKIDDIVGETKLLGENDGGGI
ncbi:MAG TPA: glycosyltransferase [Thermoanaerobacterales bacterium]|nr:glycosyltransferase [Thermoanaerobacterales bacterium]